MSHAAIYFQGKPVVICPPVIKSKDFNSLTELSKLAEAQRLPVILATHRAWHKYELMLFTEE